MPSVKNKIRFSSRNKGKKLYTLDFLLFALFTD